MTIASSTEKICVSYLEHGGQTVGEKGAVTIKIFLINYS